MTISADLEKRKELTEKFIQGTGFEVGAGVMPSAFGTVDRLIFIDKRSKEELEDWFHAAIDYDVCNAKDAQQKFPSGLDFLMAHQVLEHCSNPINVLSKEWIPLIKEEGTLFISIPSANMSSEHGRMPTPIQHIIDDWIFGRDNDTYESRDHILSFIAGWAAANPDDFWYAGGNTVQDFCAEALREVNRTCHDLHWHTYTLDTAKSMVEIAFFTAGAGMEWIHCEEIDSALYLLATKRGGRPLTQNRDLRIAQTRLYMALGSLMGGDYS